MTRSRDDRDGGEGGEGSDLQRAADGDELEGALDDAALAADDDDGVPLLSSLDAEAGPARALSERQLLLLNDRPGLRVLDTALEEIGIGSGRFRLIVELQTWRVYLSVGADNLGSASVGPWQAYLPVLHR